ncbi:ABC transporter permease [Bogoriella caseilytica]|uniref:Putative ABC transport system permease protein n=1 Tax=Bogoriella caseilytica TaxID=56055 RepID=A0A3N2BBH1_9MICO|nr:ABC transporter permease [Bogoriella caseilytica]ROR72578.1 putative ABC transport system permease protein [Bogoriella caseilytica]
MRLTLWRKQATSTAGASLLLALVVLVTAGVFTAWPRWQESVVVDDLRYRVEQAPMTWRSLTTEHHGGPLTHQEEQDFLEGLVGVHENENAVVPALLSEAVTAVRWMAVPPTPPPYQLPERHPLHAAQTAAVAVVDIGIEQDIRLMDGDVPGAAPLLQWYEQIEEERRRLEDTAPDPFTDLEGYQEHLEEIADPEAFRAWSEEVGYHAEIMISAETAEVLELDAGDIHEVPTTGGFPLGSVRVTDQPLLLRISGVFEPLDPDGPTWQHQPRLASPHLHDDPDMGLQLEWWGVTEAETAFWIESMLTRPGDGIIPLRFTTSVWIPLDVDVDSLAEAAELSTAIREFTLATHRLDLGEDASPHDVPFELDFESRLDGVLSETLAIGPSLGAVLAMISAGPLGVAIAVLALGCRMAVTRRERSLALSSARGASPGQLRVRLALEGLVIALPAAAAGAALATAALPGAVMSGHYLGAAAVALAPALFLGTASLPSLRERRADLGRGWGGVARRWGEVMVLALAAAAVYLVISRGVDGAGATDGTDPVAAASPLLVALAVCVVLLRLAPLPLLALHRLQARGRSLPGFLGSGRAVRTGRDFFVPVLAIVIGVAITVLSTVMTSTLRAGVSTGAEDAVGADIRVQTHRLDSDHHEALLGVDGVDQVVFVSHASRERTADGELLPVFYADTAILTEVQSAFASAEDLAELNQSVDGRVPAVAAAGEGLSGELEMNVGAGLPVTVTSTVSALPGIADSGRWILIDRETAEHVAGEPVPVPGIALISVVDGADTEAVAEQVESIVGSGQVLHQEGQRASFLESPSGAAMLVGFGIAVAVCAALTVLALVLTLALSAPGRSQTMSLVRVLGGHPRLGGPIVLWEVMPMVVMALLTGTLLGLGLPHLVASGVDLRPFTGTTAQPDLVYDWPMVASAAGGAILVILLCVALGATLARRTAPATTLRMGEAR